MKSVISSPIKSGRDLPAGRPRCLAASARPATGSPGNGEAHRLSEYRPGDSVAWQPLSGPLQARQATARLTGSQSAGRATASPGSPSAAQQSPIPSTGAPRTRARAPSGRSRPGCVRAAQTTGCRDYGLPGLRAAGTTGCRYPRTTGCRYYGLPVHSPAVIPKHRTAWAYTPLAVIPKHPAVIPKTPQR